MAHPQAKIRILIVDDDPLTREGFRACPSFAAHFELVAEAVDGWSAIQLAERLQPDVIIMDTDLPGLNGLAATLRILRARPTARVLMLTTEEHPDYLVEIIHAGARGCISRAVEPAMLIQAIEKIAAGELYFGQTETVRFLRRYRPAPACVMAEPIHALTSREREVLALIGQGLASREIARRLNIAPRTVETHRERLMRKLDIHDGPSLRSHAIANSLLADAFSSGAYPSEKDLTATGK